MHRRAQTGSMDVIVALAIFVSALALMFLVLRTQQANVDADVAQRDLAWNAQGIADILVSHGGTPSHWEQNPSSVAVIGLASSDHVISSSKLDAFINLSAEIVRDTWNIQPADFYFSLTTSDGDTVASAGNVSAYKSAAAVERIVIYDNETATMLLRLQQ